VATHVDRNAAVGPWVGLLGTWYKMIDLHALQKS
jgi:hypothetical protein